MFGYPWYPLNAGSAPASRTRSSATRSISSVVTPGAANHQPPSDAVVLFDGTDLSGWSGRDGAANRTMILRLLPNGTPDPTFVTPLRGFVSDVAIQRDGIVRAHAGMLATRMDVESEISKLRNPPL